MSEQKNKDGYKDLAIFQVNETLCAIEIVNIKEIIKHLDISAVQNAPEYVRGVASLRGEIISVIDVRVKFGKPSIPLNEDMRIIVINFHGENTGLLVDKIEDIHPADCDAIDPLTSNINGVNRDFFSGIYKMDKKLAAIVNTDELLKFNQSEPEPMRA